VSFSQPSSEEALEQTVKQTEHLLNAINGALQQLQEDVITQLNDDVTWLRAEKSSLLQDIAQLRQQQQHLLTETQLAQQQQWAQEFAKILARYLQQNLQQNLQPQLQEDFAQAIQQALQQQYIQQQYIQQQHIQQQSQQQSLTPGEPLERDRGLSDRDWQRLQGTIETTIEATIESILGATIDRAFRQYAQQMEQSWGNYAQSQRSQSQHSQSQRHNWEFSEESTPSPRTAPTPLPTVAPSASGSPIRSAPPAFQWHRQGIALAVLSILMLSLQYVLAQALFQFPTDPNLEAVQDLELQASWTNTALLVGLRMLIFLPLIAIFNRWLQPNLGNAVQDLFQRSNHYRQLWWNLGFSGLFLFLSQWFLFRVVGLTSAGLGVGLFFIYPGLVPLFHWLLVGDRPSQFRFQCIVALGVGATLIFSQPTLARSALDSVSLGQTLPWGIGSAVCFTLYLLISDRCNQRLNPSAVSLVQYGFVILFAVPALFNFDQVSILQLTNIGLGGLVLGGTAALSYVLHVFSVQIMGSLPSMVLNSLTPLLTAILAMTLLQSPLSIAHGLGILLITIGGVAIQMERLRP
jgi:drug/metabolite transporter (DMT)-like permease